MTRPWSRSTRVVASGRPEGVGAPLSAPIVAASTFRSDGSSPYARSDAGTETWRAFETFAGDVEGAEAISFASGMAACSAVLSLVPDGGLVGIPADCYQGVAAIATEAAASGRWRVRRVDTADTEAWVALVAEADLAWIETPSNPLLAIGDLATIASAPRGRRGLVVVDNTFATPLNQRPLDLGADVAVQSATKLIGGHSDLLSGLVTARDPELLARLNRHRGLHGATPGALESFLALRGARTLAVRLERSQASAGELATRLVAHSAVEVVRYPGLESHPGHAIAAAQLDGFGSMLSFDVVGGGPAAEAVCAGVELISHATSLGGVESTMERRAGLAGQEHLPPGLIRLSVGIEDVEDLWADLEAALPAT